MAVRQPGGEECGPTCLFAIAQAYNIRVSLEVVIAMTPHVQGGVSMLALAASAEQLGLKTASFGVDLATLRTVPVPALLHLGSEYYQHYVVLVALAGDSVLVMDPAQGEVTRWSVQQLCRRWSGRVMLFRPRRLRVPWVWYWPQAVCQLLSAASAPWRHVTFSHTRARRGWPI